MSTPQTHLRCFLKPAGVQRAENSRITRIPVKSAVVLSFSRLVPSCIGTMQALHTSQEPCTALPVWKRSCSRDRVETRDAPALVAQDTLRRPSATSYFTRQDNSPSHRIIAPPAVQPSKHSRDARRSGQFAFSVSNPSGLRPAS